MSYRALVTVIDQAANGDYRNVADFKLHLDEEFKLGEVVAHDIAKKRTWAEGFDKATSEAMLLSFPFEDHQQRKHWIDTYGDQVWTIKFREVGISGRDVEITGTDASGEMIFFRSLKYVL